MQPKINSPQLSFRPPIHYTTFPVCEIFNRTISTHTAFQCTYSLVQVCQC